MKKCIVTVLGKDTVGIVAKVCTYLAENKINVLDISQTIIQGYFNMMVIVDVTELPKDFTQMCDEMEKLGDEIGASVVREKIFLKKCTDYKRRVHKTTQDREDKQYDQYV